MGNLIEIQSQIEKLQKQAADIRAREFDKTVKEIQAMMAAFGITLNDLQKGPDKVRSTPAQGRTAARRKKAMGKKTPGKKVMAQRAASRPSAQKGVKVAPKYRGPNGETWSGRGMVPRWLASLVAQGKTRESFAVKD
jgi:DNA-binding protein H-NS